ncbi:MAG: T9SS type A sorting domain-containing protein, partial [Bacteroidetes bacterium]|nr:T9SS type A sorting domain-containing protein [Bacteroidota bacterium]
NSGVDRGDLNSDLAINVLDIVSEAGIIVGSGSPTDFQTWAGDLNIDFQIDVLDIVSMVNLILSERVGYSSPSAILDDGELRIGGSIGGIQFSGELMSDVSNGDYIVSNNGLTVIFNVSGQLATKIFIFDETPEDIIVASSDGSNVNVLIAKEYALISSYPNPFNPVTEIQYSIENSGFVTIAIYNLIGQKVINLVSGYTRSGDYSIHWNGRDEYGLAIPSGTYLISLTQNSGTTTQKVTLLK